MSACCKTIQKVAPKQDVPSDEDPTYDAGWDKIFVKRKFSSGKVVKEVLAEYTERRQPSKTFACYSMIHPYSTFSKIWVASSIVLMSYIAVMVPVISPNTTNLLNY